MGMTLPNGSQLAIATMGTSHAVTAVSNAAAAVATAAGHGLLVKDPFLFSSGWSRLDGRSFRTQAVTTDSFTMEDVNTTSVLTYPDGGGLGTVQGVASWTEITQMLDVQTSGGDPQFWTYAFVEDPEGNERQMPTGKSAMAMTLTLGDDPTLPWYDALSAADELKAPTILRMRLPKGGVIYYPTYVAFNKVPKITNKQGMTVSAAFSMSAVPTRYKAA